jgi:glucose/arabinose dehydrogenase
MKNAARLSRLKLWVGIVAGLATLSGLCGIAQAQRPAGATLGSGPFVYHTLDANFRVDVVTKGLVHPWGMTFLPDGSILVTERPGRLRIIRNGVLDPTPISGVPAVYTVGIDGLLDIALDPNFARNHYVYLAYNKPGPDLGPNDESDRVRAPAAVMGPAGPGKTMTDAVARGVWNGHDLTDVHDIFVDNSLLDDSIGAIAQDSGVRIVFGRDGKLYVSTGSPNSPADSGKYIHTRGGRAQDPTSDDGKVLRLNSDGTVPRDNPFVGKPGYRPEIYTLGNRNILGMAVNPATGQVWEDENGPQDDDKLIDLKPGANYGWPIVGVGYDYTGDHIGGPIALGDPSAVSAGYLNEYLPGIEQPFLIWVPATAPSGLSFYSGSQFQKWRGSIFVGSMKYHRIERIVLNESGGPIRREYLLDDLKQRIRDVRQGPDGDLYVLTDEQQGALLRIEPIKARRGTEQVYTAGQALRGKTAYTQSCSACHQANLSGIAQIPALKGDTFLDKWDKLGDLVDRMHMTMPPTAPGSLSQNTYFDIVAYLLQMNGLPAGHAELQGASPGLQDPVGN